MHLKPCDLADRGYNRGAANVGSGITPHSGDLRTASTSAPGADRHPTPGAVMNEVAAVTRQRLIEGVGWDNCPTERCVGGITPASWAILADIGTLCPLCLSASPHLDFTSWPGRIGPWPSPKTSFRSSTYARQFLKRNANEVRVLRAEVGGRRAGLSALIPLPLDVRKMRSWLQRQISPHVHLALMLPLLAPDLSGRAAAQVNAVCRLWPRMSASRP